MKYEFNNIRSCNLHNCIWPLYTEPYSINLTTSTVYDGIHQTFSSRICLDQKQLYWFWSKQINIIVDIYGSEVCGQVGDVLDRLTCTLQVLIWSFLDKNQVVSLSKSALEKHGWAAALELSVGYDSNPISQYVRLVHVVGGQQDRSTWYKHISSMHNIAQYECYLVDSGMNPLSVK